MKLQLALQIRKPPLEVAPINFNSKKHVSVIVPRAAASAGRVSAAPGSRVMFNCTQDRTDRQIERQTDRQTPDRCMDAFRSASIITQQATEDMQRHSVHPKYAIS